MGAFYGDIGGAEGLTYDRLVLWDAAIPIEEAERRLRAGGLTADQFYEDLILVGVGHKTADGLWADAKLAEEKRRNPT